MTAVFRLTGGAFFAAPAGSQFVLFEMFSVLPREGVFYRCHVCVSTELSLLESVGPLRSEI